MAGASPTQRTLKKLKDDGYRAAVVEKWNPHAKIRQDLFGFGDVLAYNHDDVRIIQATTGTNMAARVTKIMDDEKLCAAVLDWVVVGNCSRRCEVWGWRKVGDRGKRKLWAVRRVELYTIDKVVLHAGAVDDI